ncbi:MAG: MnhB domain-containing protein [Candidatus Omnitrophota bacterium]
MKKENLNTKQKTADMNTEKGMSIIIKTITRITVGILFLYGVNMVLHGNINPGAGFAGGGIIALAFINLILAFGKDAALEKLNHTGAGIIAGLGLFMFLVLSIIGFYEDSFIKYFKQDNTLITEFMAGSRVTLFNISICVEVGVGIFAIFFSLITLKIIEGRK